MDCRRLMIQTIPAVGAIGLSACAPVRENVGDGSGGTSIFGAWELRTYGYAGGTPYEYPYVSGYEGGCQTISSFFLQIDSALIASMTRSTVYENCNYYNEDYSYRYPGAAEDLGTGFLRITIQGWGLVMDCPQAPSSNEMMCSGAQGQQLELGFERVSADVIPDVTGGGGQDGVDF